MKTKSANLLAKGYELIDGITVPVGTSNIDLNVEGKEPQNAQKLTIVVGNEKINMFVFRPSNYKEGEVRKRRLSISFTEVAIILAMSVWMSQRYRVWLMGAAPR